MHLDALEKVVTCCVECRAARRDTLVTMRTTRTSRHDMSRHDTHDVSWRRDATSGIWAILVLALYDPSI